MLECGGFQFTAPYSFSHSLSLSMLELVFVMLLPVLSFSHSLSLSMLEYTL